jgi:hypothetical protein
VSKKTDVKKRVQLNLFYMLLFMYSSVYTIRFSSSIPRVFSLQHVSACWGYLQVRLSCYTITILLLSPTLASFEHWECVVYVLLFALFPPIVVSTVAVLRCGKQMEKLPHYNFSWTFSLQKQRKSVWKRLWTCRETD